MKIPVGAYNIRTNGKNRGKENSTRNISKLSRKREVMVCELKIKAGTKE